MQPNQETWFLQSTFPVFLPHHTALTAPEPDFQDFIRKDVGSRHADTGKPAAVAELGADSDPTDTESFAVVSTPPVSTTADVREQLGAVDLDMTEPEAPRTETTTTGAPFLDALRKHPRGVEPEPPNLEGKMLTENGDVAFRSTGAALLDLFAELEDVVSGPRLRDLLTAAWRDDALATLKIIFNARSIHLGKASRTTFYRCAGWLAEEHPATLLANLQWLSRPVIEKKAPQPVEPSDAVMVEKEKDPEDPAAFDVVHGVSHGYWKDLLNILALAVQKKLSPLVDPQQGLQVEGGNIGGNGKKKKQQNGKKDGKKAINKEDIEKKADDAETAETSELAKQRLRKARHEMAVLAFENDPLYRALHLSVARLFAAQLRADLAALHGTDAKAKRGISLCGKWAPSLKHFHDKFTFVASSIAEILHPESKFANKLPPVSLGDERDRRETYLRFARDAYRKDVAALRKHLDVVERNVSANTFDLIKYDRVPSLAMQFHAPTFAAKDNEHFTEYLRKVGSGKAKISGAVLLPSTLIKAVGDLPRPGQNLMAGANNIRGRSRGRGRGGPSRCAGRPGQGRGPSTSQLAAAAAADISAQVLDGQWKTLVQRLRDSGTLESSMAICDVSGSMSSPVMPDGTTPMDSAIGLSLCVAEMGVAPFKNHFITFSEEPQVIEVDPNLTIREKYWKLKDSPWGGSTDFVAVFEKLILPCAIKEKVKPEDMVKRVFVFSDMQFNEADSDMGSAWVYNGGTAWGASASSVTEEDVIDSTPPSPPTGQVDAADIGDGAGSAEAGSPGNTAGLDEEMAEYSGAATSQRQQQQQQQPVPPAPAGRWSSSFERVQGLYKAAGYEMPEMVFWNLAGGRAGYTGWGDETAPKPVEASQPGTALVSGYSQGMLKVFLEGGGFEDPEAEEVEAEEEKNKKGRAGEEGGEEGPAKKKARMDPLSTLRKTIGHKAYEMLRVVD